MMQTNRMIAAAAGAIAVLCALPASAEVDRKCLQEAHASTMTLHVGQKCSYLDAAAAERLKRATQVSAQCAVANATAQEKADTEKMLATSAADSATRAASMPCSAEIRGAYDNQLKTLPQ